jgi:hypothetical protein
MQDNRNYERRSGAERIEEFDHAESGQIERWMEQHQAYPPDRLGQLRELFLVVQSLRQNIRRQDFRLPGCEKDASLQNSIHPMSAFSDIYM